MLYIMSYIQYEQLLYVSKKEILLKIIISPQSELPIYAQIESQIKEQIVNGELKEGSILPSIRKLARETGVSVITTTRAYSDLEEQGFIASVQGKGTIVLPQNNAFLREQYLKRIEDSLASAISAAQTISMNRKELDSLIDILWQADDSGKDEL